MHGLDAEGGAGVADPASGLGDPLGALQYGFLENLAALKRWKIKVRLL